MKTAIRIFGGIIVLVIALGAAGIAIILSTSPEEIRDFLTAQVKVATGRDLVIKGKLDLEVSLVPSLVMNDVTFSNAKWASAPHMLSLKRHEAGLELMPLLQGEIQLTQIVLIEPNLQLETNAEGIGNWVFDTSAQKSAEKSDDDAPTIPILNRLVIEKGIFKFKDGQRGETIALSFDAVKIDAESSNRSMLVELKGGYNGIPFEIKGGLPSLDRLIVDPSSYKFNITANVLATSVSLKGNVSRPLSDRKMDIRATVSGRDINKSIELVSKLVPVLSDLKLPELGALKASVRLKGTPDKISLSDIKFNLGPTGSLEISGGGKITGLPTKPVYAVSFAVKGNDLSQFSEIAGVNLPKAPPFEIAGIFRNPNGDYAVDNLKLKLGSTDLAGNIMASLKSKVPNIQVALKSNQFNLDDILAALPKTDTLKEEKKKDDGRVFSNDPLPINGLKAIDLRFNFVGKKVVINGALVTDLTAGLNLKNGKLELKPFLAEFSKGKMTGTVTLDASIRPPKLVVNFSAKGTDVGKLLKDMDISDLLTGTADTSINLSGSGASVRQIMAGLNGKTEIVMKEGRIASKYVDLIAADLVKAIVPGGSASDTTKINCMVNRFTIKNGIATNTAMLFDTEKMTISGKGKIDLRTEKLDLQIKPEAKDPSLLSMSVPVDIGGTLKSPSALPSTTAVLKGLAGLALSVVNPVALLALTVSKGSGDKNPCVAALDNAKSGKSSTAKKAPPPQEKSSNPIESITKGIGSGLKSLFGGK